MKSTLIINFRRIGDIISLTHLVNKLTSKGDHVSLLVFEEFRSSAEAIKNVQNVYSINRKKIETFTKSELFHDSIAFNELFKEVTEVSSKAWSSVINISNDELSCRLGSFIAEKNNTQMLGTSFSPEQLITYSSEWAITYNDVLTGIKNSPLHFQDIYHQIANVGHYEPSNREKLKVSQQFESQTVTNFENIKSTTDDPNQAKIIGIQAKTSKSSKDIPFGTLVKTIQDLKEREPNWVPIILIAPNDKEREFANRLNLKFNEKLITVEANLIALSSVVKNLDALITPDTAVKHYADVFNIPTLEISLGESPLFKQGSVGPNSSVLTHRIDLRQSNPERDQHLLESDDIINSLIYTVRNESLPQLQEGFTLYRSIQDSLGIRYVAVSGDISVEKETYRVIARNYLSKHLTGEGIENIYTGFSELDSRDFRNYIDDEKTVLTETTKSLLATLRSLARSKEPGSSSTSLIGHMDHLFNLSEQERLASLPLRFFRAKIENLTPQQDKVDNLNAFEKYLFELKVNIKTLLASIEDLEHLCNKKNKKENKRTNSEMTV